MYLFTAATNFEMEPLQAAYPQLANAAHLVTGVGPLETATRLAAYLGQSHGQQIRGVINFGVAGAYVIDSGEPRAQLLDICLAERELLGDMGICFDNRIEEFTDNSLAPPIRFQLDAELLDRARQALSAADIFFRTGLFITVSCASASARRGNMINADRQGLCENMEGAAGARVCAEFNVPFLELRCISNYVEDRDVSKWRLREACKRAGQVTAVLARYLDNNGE